MANKITALALLTIINIACIAQVAQHTGSYTVQIAVYKNLPENFISSAEKYGTVHASQTGELTRISVGSFSSRNVAQELLSRLRQAGYKDAFINRIGSGIASNQRHDHTATLLKNWGIWFRHN